MNIIIRSLVVVLLSLVGTAPIMVRAHFLVGLGSVDSYTLSLDGCKPIIVDDLMGEAVPDICGNMAVIEFNLNAAMHNGAWLTNPYPQDKESYVLSR